MQIGWGVIPFCAPESDRGLHKIVQPFLRGHVFLCIPISVPQKRNNILKESTTSQILSLLRILEQPHRFS